MLLIITSSDDATADYLCKRLERERVPFVRFNTDASLSHVECTYSVHGVELRIAETVFRPLDFAHVWLRRPKPLVPQVNAPPAELQHIAREWSEAIEGFFAHIPIERWVNHPSRNAIASHKLEQISRARSLELCVPEAIVTQRPEVLRAFWERCNGQVIVKPLAYGYIDRDPPEHDSLIYTSVIKTADLKDLADLGNCPTLCQRRIDKVDDIRVTVVDDAIVAVSLRATDNGQQRTDIRRNNMEDVQYKVIEVSESIRASILALTAGYGLRFAAIDFVVDEQDRWYFLEVNPNGQWAWLDLVGKSDIAFHFVQAFSNVRTV